MPVIALADIFGIDGRREELLALFRETEASARVVPGVRRYVFAVSPSDRDRYLLVSEWETQEAMDAFHRSDVFARYQFEVGELLARPSEMSVFTVTEAVKPVASGLLDPRRAD
jgi:quinol monooxygenase YgiN